MGAYIPAKSRPKRSVRETLEEAEEEHFLGCPNADFLSRTAALMLDGILIYLINLIFWQAGNLLLKAFGWDLVLVEGPFPSAVFIVRYLVHALIFFHYLIWTVAHFGGSPGKLIIGLRVVDLQSGERLGTLRVLLREFAAKPISFLPLGVGILFVLFRKDRLALHDLISQSAVKKLRGES